MSILTNHRSAGYPAVAISTHDEAQTIGSIAAENEHTYTYSANQEIRQRGKAVQPHASWSDAISFAAAEPERVVIISDAQHVLSNPPIYRALLDAAPRMKQIGSTVVFLAPSWKLPPELEHAVPVLSWKLPTRDELRAPLQTIADSAGITINGNTDRLLDAAAGLTLEEAESAFALSCIETGGLTPEIVSREKMRRIRSTGYLDVSPVAPMESVGGLGNLKDYIEREIMPSMLDAQLAVRGLLLVGIPGGGKSLSARAIGAALRWPVVRLDVSACKGSLVGQSESNIRAATTLAEAVSPCVVWIDEIEKALGGHRSSAQTDGGTTLGIVGHLLTWLQEHRSPIVTVATCNDYAALPPELTRAGRFDERFFVDLPTSSERRAIADIHLTRLECEVTEDTLSHVAQLTERWTGAEIEQLARSAARRTQRNVTPDALTLAAAEIRPISQTRATEIQQLRAWAADTLRLANDPEDSTPASLRRLATASA